MAKTLKIKYEKEIKAAMKKEFNYKNDHEIPRVVKVVVNRGVGEAVQNPKALDIASNELAQITGQKPLITKAKKSIAVFKVRAKQPVGCKVTLRGSRMYQFLDKLINLSLPRIRDFKGVPPKSFDGKGNYTLGITEQLIFPEIDYDKVDKTRGMDITICTSAKTDDEARSLLKYFGVPYRAA
ncbi:MAG: 50S ribosomal protein L5 [Candidatus Saganbacteria bacterium]|nr:50S ribosomal protein L5 [Candidatus Saganbacteria bacterium]